MSEPMSREGVRKVAIVLSQLDPAHSAVVLGRLSEEQMEAVTAEISRLRDLEREEADAVVEEMFVDLLAQRESLRGGPGFAREVLVATLGPDRADAMLARVEAREVRSAFAFLDAMPADEVVGLLDGEHPQTIAVVLTQMGTPAASAVLRALPAELQTEVAHRIATMRPTNPGLLRSVGADLLARVAAAADDRGLEPVGGLDPLVEIIGCTDRDTERSILTGLEGRDPELAEEVRSRLFVFEDVVRLDDRAAQLVLRSVETADLAVALKGADEAVRDKVLRNMSERAAQNLAEEIDLLGAVRRSAVDEARKKIVGQIRALDESGEIAITRGNVEESLV